MGEVFIQTAGQEFQFFGFDRKNASCAPKGVHQWSLNGQGVLINAEDNVGGEACRGSKIAANVTI
jgi:hypothetical protein